VTTATMNGVRTLSLATPVFKFIVKYLESYLGDQTNNEMCSRFIGAERVEFLPIPAKSTTGTMLFSSDQGITKTESRGPRALFALPLLVFAGSFSFISKQNPEPLLRFLDMSAYLIWILEASRSTNHLKLIQW